MNISSVQPSLTPAGVNRIQGTRPAAEAEKSTELSFDKMLQTLDKTQAESDVLLQKLAAGEEVDLHQVMIATEQTDISFRVALAIRDKLVDAYREVMRMNV